MVAMLWWTYFGGGGVVESCGGHRAVAIACWDGVVGMACWKLWIDIVALARW